MTMSVIFQTAQMIDINRSKLISQTVSRNGKLLVASRNWVNPWRFTVDARPMWNWTEFRSYLEPIINADRYTTHTVSLGTNAFTNTGANWIAQYQGSLPSDKFGSDLVCNGAAGATFTLKATGATQSYIASQSDSFVVLKAGDLIQSTSGLYPHAVTTDITKAMATTPSAGIYTWTVPIHRGWLDASPVNSILKVGSQCTFQLVVTKMPTYKALPGKYFEFTSAFELMEYVA